jgi:hypothetical protein
MNYLNAEMLPIELECEHEVCMLCCVKTFDEVNKHVECSVCNTSVKVRGNAIAKQIIGFKKDLKNKPSLLRCR